RVAMWAERPSAPALAAEDLPLRSDRTTGSVSGNAVPAGAAASTEVLVTSWAWDGQADPFAEPLQNPWDKAAKTATWRLGSAQRESGAANGGEGGAPDGYQGLRSGRGATAQRLA